MRSRNGFRRYNGFAWHEEQEVEVAALFDRYNIEYQHHPRRRSGRHADLGFWTKTDAGVYVLVECSNTTYCNDDLPRVADLFRDTGELTLVWGKDEEHVIYVDERGFAVRMRATATGQYEGFAARTYVRSHRAMVARRPHYNIEAYRPQRQLELFEEPHLFHDCTGAELIVETFRFRKPTRQELIDALGFKSAYEAAERMPPTPAVLPVDHKTDDAALGELDVKVDDGELDVKVDDESERGKRKGKDTA